MNMFWSAIARVPTALHATTRRRVRLAVGIAVNGFGCALIVMRAAQWMLA
ncbi:MAG: hypothetical protein ABI440_15690 [Casimicrobiaceae bacterium]